MEDDEIGKGLYWQQVSEIKDLTTIGHDGKTASYFFMLFIFFLMESRAKTSVLKVFNDAVHRIIFFFSSFSTFKIE